MPRYGHLRIACKNHVKQRNKAQIEERVPSDTFPFTAIAVQGGPGPAVVNRGHTKSGGLNATANSWF